MLYRQTIEEHTFAVLRELMSFKTKKWKCLSGKPFDFSLVVLILTMQKPILHKRIFWDTDFDKIDYDKSHRSVIERVFERGDVEDIREIRRYYGDTVIIGVLTTAKWLRYDIFIFCRNLFNLKAEDFRCYTSRQLNEIPWLY